METLVFARTSELKREKEFLEKKLNVKISISGRRVTFSGKALDEYEASLVLNALDFGFPARVASLLTDPDFIFTELNIKDFTKRKNTEEIRGRIIGKHGQTKKTIEEISGCRIIIKDNQIGIISPCDEIEYIATGITNLIRGTKQSNVYKYLERINTKRKTRA